MFPRVNNVTHKGNAYEIRAELDTQNDRVKVRAFGADGQPAVITYPDGFRATPVYTVDFMTRLDMKRQLGVDAVTELMATAEADLRRLG